MSDAVGYDVEGAVATITLNRPDAMNAVDSSVKSGLKAALAEASGDAGVRAVVLTGAGRAFCVGQDLRELLPLYERGDAELGNTVTEDYNPIVLALAAELPKPTVAAVNGPAAGAGASLAFACDFRIAADTASFTTAFAKIGLVGDSGASWTLPRLVGRARALELLMLSETVPAEEALRLGLVTRVVPAAALATEVAGFAARLAAGPTQAYHQIRRQVTLGQTADLAEALALEGELQAQLGRSNDHLGAVRAFLAKQPPTFEGR